ncbi:hypothetical protein J6590_079414 [Homalodisca vitripennis]|nr:hypothetical protein J6590_079414 [Homalodisca vitripennis]
MGDFGMIVLNGRSESDKNGNYTFVGPMGSSVIDLALMTGHSLHLIRDFEVVCHPGSDHLPIKILLKMKEVTIYGFKKFISHEPIITKGPIPVPLPLYFRHLVLASRHDCHWLVPLVSRRWSVDE